MIGVGFEILARTPVPKLPPSYLPRPATSRADKSDYPRTIFELSFGATKMATYVNKMYVCFFVTINMQMCTTLIIRVYIKLKI